MTIEKEIFKRIEFKLQELHKEFPQKSLSKKKFLEYLYSSLDRLILKYFTEEICSFTVNFPKGRKEKWKRIYDVYAVSNLGRVKRLKGGPGANIDYIFKGSKSDTGYISVVLRIKGRQVAKFVHKLVAETFIGPRPKKHIIHHKDGNKLNNAAENLAYITQSQNIQHAYDTHLRKTGPRGEHNRAAKLSSEKVLEIRKLRGSKTQKAIGEIFGVRESTICNILKGKTWSWV